MSYPKRKGSIDRLRQIPLAIRIARMRMKKKLKEKEIGNKKRERPTNRSNRKIS